MATISLERVRAVRMLDNAPPPTLEFEEAASQVYKIGDFVVLNTSSGRVELCGADPALILGIAAKAATGVTGAKTLVTVATPNVVFAANFKNGSGNLVLAITHVSNKYGLLRDGTNLLWTVDSSETTTTEVTVLGPARGSAIDDTNARIEFTIRSARMQLFS